jgi:thymidylate synthase (FAD)
MSFKAILDKGYVRLVEARGTDLSVVNSARVSYNKEVDELGERDEKLIHFLAREGHMSPFRHASLQFECYAPLMVARQWWKHHVASTFVESQNAWNESSRRYVTEYPEFYLPDINEWRSKPDNSKQGSGEVLPSGQGIFLRTELEDFVQEGMEKYEKALEMGVAPEMARLFLPANGLYVRFYWHVSLEAVLHFLKLRVAKDSQKEIQEYAIAIDEFVKEAFPISYHALMEEVK